MTEKKSIEGKFYGIERSDEEKKFKRIMDLANNVVKKINSNIGSLQAELHELRDVYDLDEKEGLAQWFNTDARFDEVRKDLLRAERAVKKPYFGRIDIEDEEFGKRETLYIGKAVLGENTSDPEVIDWRAPISSVYYDHSLGQCTYKVPSEGIYSIDLKRKRTYEINDKELVDYYDSDVVANDDLLTKYLSKSKRNVLSEIIATIQEEQNRIIRRNPRHNVLVQGSAGSGKTTVAMHRISYILYNYEREFKPESFYIVGSNKVLLNYITGVLPDLDVYGVSQMTMAELFVRLLYEDWDNKKYKIRSFDKKDKGVSAKSNRMWFERLKRFAKRIESELIPQDDIKIEKNGHVILSAGDIRKVMRDLSDRAIIEKIERLNDLLMSGLETELYGRYYSYNVEEQKKLKHHYRNYFNKFLYKKSVFNLYEQFMAEQKAIHPEISYVKGEPDLYDLASLAYLYKKIKETEVIQEASHVVIDEAQDFGIMVYIALKYCMSKCTFTIMGDVAQNINFESGLGDWEELKNVMLPDRYDYFGLLKKSYRNTIEISNFATDILRHATFPIYPVEPIVRHGEEVKVEGVHNSASKGGKSAEMDKLVSRVFDEIVSFEEKNYETIAVICKDNEEALAVAHKLNKCLEASDERNTRLHGKGGIRLFSDRESEGIEGVVVLPIEYSKGLEFDAVIVFDASKEAYPYEDNYAKLLYVAATRALHELSVFYKGELTGLIAEPVPADRKNINFEDDSFHIDPYEFEEEFKSKATIAKENATHGDMVLRDRDTYGPRRIEKVLKEKEEKDKAKENNRRFIASQAPSGRYLENELKAKTSSKKVEEDKRKLNENEFNTMPEGTSLNPSGHGRIDASVKWVYADKQKVDIVSFYGTLRVIPLGEDSMRVIFFKDEYIEIQLPETLSSLKKGTFFYKDQRDSILIEVKKLKAVIDKRSGIISFYDSQNNLLLAEKDMCPRQLHQSEDMCWEYFNFSKKESIQAMDFSNDCFKQMDNCAKFVSNGKGGREATLMSSKGYQLVVPAGIKTLLCTIPAYGPYVRFEGAKAIDYIIRSAR